MEENKLRGKSDHHGDVKQKKKEMSPSTSRKKIADSKIDDMTKLIKNMSTKLSRLEMENKSQNKPIQDTDNKNPNQFRRTFKPMFFPRDRRNNEDKKISLISKII